MEDSKKPCAPVEEACRDYNELGIYLHKEKNRTREAAEILWEVLPGWMAARRMAFADPEYNKRISAVVAENAEIILKAAREMAEWVPEANIPSRKDEAPTG